MQVGAEAKDRHRFRRGVEIGLVAAVALAIRLVDLGYPPFIDEFHHYLAASSLLADGTLVIHDGEAYRRGWLFTYLVAGFFAMFGQSLEVARLPAVVSGVLLVCLLFAWLRAEAGRVAAWTAALLLSFSPIAIYLSQWVRFYMLQALLFWLGAYAVYRLVARTDSGWRRLWIGAGAVAAFVLAFHMQITTAIGVGGVALFAVVVEGARGLASVRDRKQRWIVVGGTALGLAAVFVCLAVLGVIEWLLHRATLVDVWAIERANEIQFYHYLLVEEYGFLWVLFPAATLVALASRWRLALLFACVFGVSIVSHSFMAWKAERYLFYAMPALFGIWGLAAQEMLPWLWNHLTRGFRGLLEPLPRVVRHGFLVLALAAAAAFTTTGLNAYTTTRQVFVQGKEWSPRPGYRTERVRGHSDWEAAEPRLGPLADSVEIIVGEPDLKVIHYLGDVDFVLYAGHLAGLRAADHVPEMRPEFTVWPKVSRPLVSAPESIALLMECYASGLIVAEEHVWGWRWAVPPETAEFVERNARAVDLPAGTKVKAYRWEGEGADDSARCEAIREVRREAALSKTGS